MRNVLQTVLALRVVAGANAFLPTGLSNQISNGSPSTINPSSSSFSSTTRKSLSGTNLSMSTPSAAILVPSWDDVKSKSFETQVGSALEQEVKSRQQGKGSAHVQNTLRLFNSDQTPKITLYRDHAGWCPYCQKTMLLIEEKEIPIKIGLVPMRSYGDKPREFLQKVPNGLLPAIEVEDGNGNSQVITESQVIMELLDQWHPTSAGYKPMLPEETDAAGTSRVQQLARLERELFSWWCTLLFRPEGPRMGGNMFDMLKGNGGGKMSGAMSGFLDCMKKVDAELTSTPGPWFFDKDHPTMIDFIYVSHVERMLASCAYWKGLNLRDPKWNLKGLVAWLEAFEKRENYVAFKSDYYTHVMDIPPQYGPGYDGGFEEDRVKFSRSIQGRDGSWSLPLPHDDPLQPLYRGPPLPLAVLESMGLEPSTDGTYESCDKDLMAKACRHMAGWKLAGNGSKVAGFAARGGPMGAGNPRKTFGAELADPYAAADGNVEPYVDVALRIVCMALLADSATPDDSLATCLKASIPEDQTTGVISSLAYVRDRVGVPRDLPLAAGRQLRAYLNWAIDVLA